MTTQHTIKRIMPLLIGVMLYLSLAQVADAQSFEALPTLTEIEEAAGEADDRSREILEAMLGDFAKNPIGSIGPSQSLMGSLFFIFNACLFVIGGAFIGYQAVVAITESANQGEVMGKRMSGVWIPIRMGVGIFGMLPVFYGFSLAQALMLFLAILGIGVANLLTDTAVTMASSGNAIIPAPGISSARSGTGFTSEIAETMFVMQVCVRANERSGLFPGTQPWGGVARIEPVRSETGRNGLFSKGSGGKVFAFTNDCGEISLPAFDSVVRDDTFWQNRFGYRNSAINYDSINAKGKELYQIRTDELLTLFSKVSPLANTWFDQFDQGGTPAYPQEEINKLLEASNEAEQSRIQAQITDLTSSMEGAIKQEAQENMRKGGWMSIGSWYATFAENNNAIQSAAAVADIEIKEIGNGELSEIPKNLIEPFEALAAARQNAENDCGILSGTRTAVGGCSMGQGIAVGILNGITHNSGGEGMVNPIIASKVIGDYMLFTAGSIISAGILSGPASFVIDKTPAGKVLGKLKGAATKAIDTVDVKDKDGNSFLGRIASLVLTAMVVMGLIFAVYIPLIPFITWFTALLSYFSSVVEGLVAAQVWAFTHLNSDGEGMGQKAERGYIYMLNMLLRPSLMVMGFFFASSISVLLGTFLFQEVGTAIANAQGNSMTGPMIIFGIIAVVMLVLLTLIQTVFNLIYEVPDRTIAWFGHGMEAKMAQQMDKAVESKMDQSARWGGNIAIASGVGGMGK